MELHNGNDNVDDDNDEEDDDTQTQVSSGSGEAAAVAEPPIHVESSQPAATNPMRRCASSHDLTQVVAPETLTQDLEASIAAVDPGTQVDPETQLGCSDMVLHHGEFDIGYCPVSLKPWKKHMDNEMKVYGHLVMPPKETLAMMQP